jgi:hypothetical protein
MKQHFYTLLVLVSLAVSPAYSFSQGTCATATPIADGACRTGDNMPGGFSGGFAGCNGGTNPVRFYSFTAPANGDCVQFNIANPSTNSTWEIMIFTAGCAAYVPGSGGCIENVVTGRPFSVSGQDGSGNNILTPGNSYVLILSASNASTYDICFTSPSAQAASNECSGAINISTQLTYYNGGDCQFSGSFDDASTTDPTPAQLCAGSLENSQWVSFTASSTANVVLTGSNISCTGGGCGFQFGVFSAGVSGNCCGALNNIGCYGNKVCSGGQSTAGPTNPAGRVTWSGTSTSGFTATITGVAAGEVFCFVMDGNADADCQYNLAATGIVPIVLSAFSGHSKEEGIELNWTSLQEVNASHFEIYRSQDGVVYDHIGRVDAKAPNFGGTNYTFLDRQNLEGEHYYYLRLVDLDGSFQLSETIQIDHAGSAMNAYVTEDLLHVELVPGLAQASGVTISITDVQGRAIASYTLQSGERAFTADLSSLGAGIYMATITSPGHRETKKFLLR